MSHCANIPPAPTALCQFASWLPSHLGMPTLRVLLGTKKCIPQDILSGFGQMPTQRTASLALGETEVVAQNSAGGHTFLDETRPSPQSIEKLLLVCDNLLA